MEKTTFDSDCEWPVAGSPSTLEKYSTSPKQFEAGVKDASPTATHDTNGPETDAQYVEGRGDLQLLDIQGDKNLKLARDGQTVLIPQPSDDPRDPLNWSFAKKHLVLATLIYASYLTDFGITWGVPLFAAQTATFQMSLPEVAHSISGALFMQGVGGVLAVPLVQRLGRLPVLFWSQFLTCIVVAIAAVSPNYAMFTAFRTLQGFVNTAPQVIGLSIVHDMFFFHERTRRVNIWVFCFAGGPSLGPFLSAWLSLALSWQATFGLLAALHVLATLFIIFCGDETLYDRESPQPREAGILGRAKLLIGITGARAKGRPTIWDVSKHMAELQFKPQLFFISVVYTTTLFAWVIGVTTTIPEILTPPPYSFSRQGIALSFLAPLAGAIVGEGWGHWFNDWLCARFIRKHNGVYVLENRLWGAYLSTAVALGALVLFGESLQHYLHWSAPLVAWAALTWSLLVGTTVTSAYVLDSFPKHACLVSGIVNFWRVAGGFCVNYFQLPWIHATGPAVSFGLQAMILAVTFLIGVVMTQVFGQRWRRKYAAPPAEN